jgi:hypothetical protein
MKKTGSELEFLSTIGHDGFSLMAVSQKLIEIEKNRMFVLIPLSLTEKTFIAFNMNVYTVRLKKTE